MITLIMMHLLLPRAGKAEAKIVVTIVGRIVVTIRRTTVAGTVVPTAAPIHAVGAAFDTAPPISLMLRHNNSSGHKYSEENPTSAVHL